MAGPQDFATGQHGSGLPQPGTATGTAGRDDKVVVVITYALALDIPTLIASAGF